jgi:eukaryotic-like serine/threonine-protein kinase
VTGLISTLSPGSHFGVDERYRVEERVGEGAQGLIFRIFDTRLQRSAAAKVSSADSEDAERVRDRFEHELRYASRFSHPRILQVFDAGDLPSGAPWVVLEWMASGSLQHVLAGLAEIGRKLPVRYVKYYGLCIAEALDAVHRSGLVHRDVKPGNVLISGSGETKLGDFGVASEWEVGAPPTKELAGTPGFMATEQLAGRAEPGSDLFGLGACVFAMLVGRAPRQTAKGDLPSGVVQRTEFQEVPEEFRPFLRRCLASDRKDRYSDAAEAGRALLAVDARGDGRQRLARAKELPPEPQGGLRAAAVEGEADLLFELVDDTQAHPSPGMPAGRTLSPPPTGTGSAVGTTVFDDRGLDGWMREDSRVRVLIGVIFAVGIAIAFAAAWLLKPPPEQDLNALVIGCEEALLGGGDWTLPVDLSLSGLTKSDRGQLLQVCAALVAGDFVGARTRALAVGAADDWVAPRLELHLATTARLGPSRDYAEAARRYTAAVECDGEGCGLVRGAAQGGLHEACLVLEYSQAECEGRRTLSSSRALGLARSVVLLDDGLHGLAWTNLQYALELPRVTTAELACEELRLLGRWTVSKGLSEALRGPVAEAVALGEADCSTLSLPEGP